MDQRLDPYIPSLLLALALAPQVLKLPPWALIWCGGCWGYGYWGAKKGWNRPGPVFKIILAGLAFVGVLLSYGSRLGGTAYVSVLAVMAALKILEVRSHRDRMITIFVAYFIVIASLFDFENLVMTLYMFFSVFVTTAVLIRLHQPGGSAPDQLRLAGRILLQAAPLMIALFMLFPRVQGSLWGFSRTETGTSGFSDDLSPGDISRMVLSNAVAFRAEFDGPIPPPEQRYWRGLTFEVFDGEDWHPGAKGASRGRLAEAGNPVDYTVTLEPHQERWLFALDIPGRIPPHTWLTHDFTLRARHDIHKKRRYRLRSYTRYHTGPLHRWEQKNRRLPARGNPRARALARQWEQNSQTAQQVLDKALDFLEAGDFAYTLRPPPLEEEIVDGFLFESRQGYCEHYAVSFAFLMRAAGLPARVVVGYLGGEVNPYGGYLIVRQSDAHAWNEVWLADAGWIRVDPTAIVAPARVAGGMAEALSPDELPGFLNQSRFGRISAYWREVRFGWDAVNNQWDRWVMGYAFEQQQGLLSRLGIDIRSGLGMIKTMFLILAFLGAAGGIFAFLLLRRRSGSAPDPAARAYGRFCRKMARAGLTRRPAQGPRDYARNVALLRPELGQSVWAITDLYIRVRYGRHAGKSQDISRLKRLVKGFSPRRIASEQKDQKRA